MSIINFLRVDPKSHIPLATQLSQQLKWLIASNKIPPGTKLPPVRQLGKHLNISFHTVNASYQQLEEDGLVSIRQGVGTTVLPKDMHTIGGISPGYPTFTIGIIIPGFVNFYHQLLRGIQDAAKEDPSLIFICDAQEDEKTAESYLDQLIARGVDGIIVVSIELPENTKSVLASRLNSGIPPIVFAENPGYPQPLVRFDLEQGGFMIAKHLIEHGHTRIGIIIPPIEWLNLDELYRGYQRAFEEAGLLFPEELVVHTPKFGLDMGYKGAQNLLALEQPPSAILPADDMMALGAMRAIKEKGLSIPEDIALVGFDDIQMASLVDPQLTTIRLPAYEMGEKAYTTLRSMIDGHAVDQSEVILGTELIVRQSCGCDHMHRNI